MQKKMQSLEGQFDHCAENLFNANIKLEEREKVLVNAETDVGNLSRRIVLLEEEVREKILSTYLKTLINLKFLSEFEGTQERVTIGNSNQEPLHRIQACG